MPVNKSVMNRHRDRHHESAFPYDGFSGIQQRIVIAASLLLCAGDGSKVQVGSRTCFISLLPSSGHRRT